MIIRGGYNVYPRELEEVLMGHPAVSFAAVIGVPNDQHGEEIKAVVVKNKDVDVSEADLVAWGKEQFAAYESPRTEIGRASCRERVWSVRVARGGRMHIKKKTI